MSVELKYHDEFLFISNLIFPYIIIYKNLSQVLHDNRIVSQPRVNALCCMTAATQGLS